MIRCPNNCKGGLVTKKILFLTRKTDCHVCKGRGFVVDTAKFYSKIGECFNGWDIKISPKGASKYLVEVIGDEGGYA